MKRYKSVLRETQNLDELVGWLKGKYNSLSQVKGCSKFKKLSFSDKEYIIDELKNEGWK